MRVLLLALWLSLVIAPFAHANQEIKQTDVVLKDSNALPAHHSVASDASSYDKVLAIALTSLFFYWLIADNGPVTHN